MKIDHSKKLITTALGVSEEKYKKKAEEIQQEIMDHMVLGDKYPTTKVVEEIITTLRKEHLNTNIEPSLYELEMFVMGYLFGRIMSPEHFRSLETAAMLKSLENKP